MSVDENGAVRPGAAVDGLLQSIQRLSTGDREQVDGFARIARGAGYGEDEATRIGVAALAALKNEPLVRQVDDVRVANGNLFMTYMPHGQRAPMFYAAVNMDKAAGEEAGPQVARLMTASQQQVELDQQLAAHRQYNPPSH